MRSRVFGPISSCIAGSRRWIRLPSLVLCSLAWSNAPATYSIVAWDSATNACGVAVQTNNFAPFDARSRNVEIDETLADIAVAQATLPLASRRMTRALQAAPNDARLRHKAMRIAQMAGVTHPVS
jgi:ribosomal protein L12E/L44/L45/RPP1/RPP2